MNKLLDIVFQSGDFYNQESTSFWENLFGALIGASSALFIFYLETWREKKKVNKQKSEQSENNLQYFSSLIDAIIVFAEKQYTAYEIHSKKIKENPFENHLLQKIISDDLNRVLNRLDNEKLFHSYINKFGNSTERIKTFQKIFSRLDYMYILYEQANKSQEMHLSDLTERLIRYKDLAEEQTLNYCSLLGNYIKNTNSNFQNDPFYNTINNAVIKYYETAPNPITIYHIQEHFIKKIKEEIISKFRNIDEGMKIADNCRKATWLYNETIKKSELSANEFEEYFKGLKKATEELKKITKDLK